MFDFSDEDGGMTKHAVAVIVNQACNVVGMAVCDEDDVDRMGGDVGGAQVAQQQPGAGEEGVWNSGGEPRVHEHAAYVRKVDEQNVLLPDDGGRAAEEEGIGQSDGGVRH